MVTASRPGRRMAVGRRGREFMRFSNKQDAPAKRPLMENRADSKGMSERGTAAGRANEAEPDWESVVAEHEGPLLRYAARLLNDAAAAEDVVQEALVRLYRHWTPALPNDHRLRQWLYRTTHNAAVDHIRAESRRRHVHEEAAREHELFASSATAEMEAADRKRAVLDRLGELDPSEREVLILRLQEGLSYRDIARITGRRIGTVGCLIHTATRKLVERLKQGGVL